MYPKLRFSYPPTLLQAARNLPKSAQRQFKKIMQTSVKPEVQRQVDDLLGEPAPPVKYPFLWSNNPAENALLRAAYFASAKQIPYQRTGNLEKSWRVKMFSRFQKDFLIVENPIKYAPKVYPGPEQLPGHKPTWGKDFDTAIVLIRDDAVILIKDAWRDSLLKALRVK